MIFGSKSKREAAMKRKFLIVTVLAAAATVMAIGNARAGDDRFKVPRVAYSEPKNQSTVDLTGKKTLTFRWNPVPMPAGGRETFRFKIYKGFSYDILVSQDIDSRTFSIDIPSDKFVGGQTYTWRVQQRDSQSMIWSLYDTWSFKVLAK